MALADAITARVAATRQRLLAGGLLQEISWGVPGDRDRYGRRTFTWATLFAYIQSGQALDRDRYSTDRADDILLVILEPLAIKDDHLFRWGDPIMTFKVKSISGLLQDEDTGVRFSSEVTVIR